MEQLFSGFAPHREAARAVGPRFQAALHVLANSQIFILHFIADVHRFNVVRTLGLAHIAEIEIEDYGAMISINWNDIVRVHISLVAIDHHVRILPEIPRTIALASGSCSGIVVGGDHGTGLKTVTVFIFDGVLLVIENGTQTLVQVGYVISAVEIVIDIHLPIAMNIVRSAIEIMQFADAEGRDALHQAAQKFLQGRGIGIKVHEDKAFPGLNANWKQPVLSTIKIQNAFEFRHAFQRSIQPIFPTVVRTLQDLCMAAGLSNNRGGVVPADVVEGAQSSLGAANDYDRLSRKPGADEVPWHPQLIGAGNQLPCLAEHVQPLQFSDARINVPGRGNSGSLWQRGSIVIDGENLLN